jgi:hypothetical protein
MITFVKWELFKPVVTRLCRSATKGMMARFEEEMRDGPASNWYQVQGLGGGPTTCPMTLWRRYLAIHGEDNPKLPFKIGQGAAEIRST